MVPDVNKPVENPRLAELLGKLKTAGDSGRDIIEQIAEEIALNAHLLAVIIVSQDTIERNEDGTSTFKKGGTISFEMVSDQAGTPFLPVYTDWNELRKGERFKPGTDVDTMIMSFDDMAAMMCGKGGVVVNMFSDHFVIGPKELMHMKQHKDVVTKGFSEQVTEKDTTVQIAEPADIPKDLAKAVIRYAGTNRDIRAIWLKLMIKDGETSYLMIVDFQGDRDTVFKGIADATVPHIHNGMYLDMVAYSDNIGQQAASGTPFFKRKILS